MQREYETINDCPHCHNGELYLDYVVTPSRGLPGNVFITKGNHCVICGYWEWGK